MRKLDGTKPLASPRVDAFGEDLDLERAGDVATQAGGEPELVVVARAGIEADHQAHVAQAVFQHLEVGGQVERARFFAGFDQADDARVWRALRLQRLHRADGRVDGVTVVGATAAIELAVFDLGRPGPQVRAPAVELGLLVQVAVHQHGLGHGLGACRLGGSHLEEDHRRAACPGAPPPASGPPPCVLRPTGRRRAPRGLSGRGPASRRRTWGSWQAPRCSRPGWVRCVRSRLWSTKRPSAAGSRAGAGSLSGAFMAGPSHRCTGQPLCDGKGLRVCWRRRPQGGAGRQDVEHVESRLQPPPVAGLGPARRRVAWAWGCGLTQRWPRPTRG